MNRLAHLLCAAIAAATSAAANAAATQHAVRVHRNADGSVNAVVLGPVDPATLRRADHALFHAAPDELLPALGNWIAGNRALLGLERGSGAPAKGPELLPGARRPASFGELSLHFVEQRYRGHPVMGSGSRLSVTLAPGGRVLGVSGRLLDPEVVFAGLDDPIAPAQARAAASKAWAAAGLDPAGTIRDVEYLAVPDRRSMGYLAPVRKTGRVVGRVLIGAADGTVLDVREERHEDAFDHRIASVMAYPVGTDPDSPAPVLHGGQPASTFAGCQPPWFGGCFLRMGDDRFSVYDFELDNADVPVVWLTNECQFTNPGNPTCFPWAMFNATDTSSFRFKTQNVFQKVAAALEAYDPIMNPIGWEHDEDAPFSLFTPPPLSVLTNVDSSPENGEPDSCDGALGWFSALEFGPEWEDVEHPYVTDEFETSAIVLCQQDESVAFHELGHYFDMHAAYGVMGDGLATDSCMPDTADESLPLRETLADMAALYLYARLYPNLPYTIDTSANSCDFGPLGTTTASVHDAACIADASQIASFEETRPAQDPSNSCNVAVGYQQSSIYQAWWEFLRGASCSMQAPYGCTFDDADPDAALEAMLYAATVSNLQSYVQFFENMGLWIAWQYPDQYPVYLDSMVEHDILEDPEADADSDGVADSADNCTLVPNPTQCNGDGDAYGNHCDPDLDQSGSVDFRDLAIMKESFFSRDPGADLNCSGSVDFADLGILKDYMFGPPGPGGRD